MASVPSGSPDADRVRAAEVIGLCLATDLGMGLPSEHGLQSTLFAVRLSERLGVDVETRRQTYYACLLFHSGCTADADLAAEIFGSSMTEHHLPVLFGSRAQNAAAVARALPPPGVSSPRRVLEVARRAPRAMRMARPHMTAACEVAEMLAKRVGLPASVTALFADLTERWDGAGPLRRAKREGIPLPLRIVHVARHAAVQRMLHEPGEVAAVVRGRAGHAFDPEIAASLAEDAGDILELEHDASAWEQTLASEPGRPLTLRGAQIDRALAAMGDFADLASPHLAGHSAGVAALAAAAAHRCGLGDDEVVAVRRAGSLHDLGRVAVHPGVWHEPGPLSQDEWEQVRLHAYHSERVLVRSAWLTPLASLAGAHHERLDGSGYTAARRPPSCRRRLGCSRRPTPFTR
jgi:HD-GYP domain-containing protein (c-di-GMP phosphodiesterase class II)